MEDTICCCFITLIIIILIISCNKVFDNSHSESFKTTTQSNINNLKALTNFKKYQSRKEDPNSNFNIIESQQFTEQEDKYPSYDKAFSDHLTGWYGMLCSENKKPQRFMYNLSAPTKNTSIDLRHDPVYVKPDYEKTGIFWHTSSEGNYQDQRVCKRT